MFSGNSKCRKDIVEMNKILEKCWAAVQKCYKRHDLQFMENILEEKAKTQLFGIIEVAFENVTVCLIEEKNRSKYHEKVKRFLKKNEQKEALHKYQIVVKRIDNLVYIFFY